MEVEIPQCWLIFRSWASFFALGRFLVACRAFFAHLACCFLVLDRSKLDFGVSRDGFSCPKPLFFVVFPCLHQHTGEVLVMQQNHNSGYVLYTSQTTPTQRKNAKNLFHEPFELQLFQRWCQNVVWVTVGLDVGGLGTLLGLSWVSVRHIMAPMGTASLDLRRFW